MPSATVLHQIWCDTVVKRKMALKFSLIYRYVGERKHQINLLFCCFTEWLDLALENYLPSNFHLFFFFKNEKVKPGSIKDTDLIPGGGIVYR